MATSNKDIFAAVSKVVLGALTDEQVGKFTRISSNAFLQHGNAESVKELYIAAALNALNTSEGKQYIREGANLFLNLIAEQNKKPE